MKKVRINETEYKSQLILQLEKDNYYRNYYLLYSEQGDFIYTRESNEQGEDPEALLILKNLDALISDLNKFETEELIEQRKYWWEEQSAFSFYNLMFAHEDYIDTLSQSFSGLQCTRPDQSNKSTELIINQPNIMEKCA